jgi:hypothetical protein
VGTATHVYCCVPCGAGLLNLPFLPLQTFLWFHAGLNTSDKLQMFEILVTCMDWIIDSGIPVFDGTTCRQCLHPLCRLYVSWRSQGGRFPTSFWLLEVTAVI